MTRHKSKHYILLKDDAVSNTVQYTEFLMTSSEFHRTFIGGHIQLTVTNDNSATNTGFFLGALVTSPEGESANTLQSTAGGSIYVPEENVLWSTAIYLDEAQDATLHFNEPLGAKRKIPPGDTLAWINLAENAGMSASLGGLINYYILT